MANFSDECQTPTRKSSDGVGNVVVLVVGSADR